MIVMVGFNINAPFPTLEGNSFVDPSQGVVRITSQLYFVYDGMLHVERQRVSIQEGNYELSILKALEKGPMNHRFRSVFDFEIDFLTVENINNTCYVNLTGPWLEKAIEEEYDLTLYLWSIVNSLTELKSVMRVQLMYEGNPIDLELLGFSLLDPLPRSESLIYSKDQTAFDVVKQFVNYIYSGRYDLAYSLLNSESQANIEYLEFIQYTNSFLSEYKDFKPVSGYSKIFPSSQIVFIRFEKPYEAGEFTLSFYENWTVKREQSIYKIYLPPQFKL